MVTATFVSLPARMSRDHPVSSDDRRIRRVSAFEIVYLSLAAGLAVWLIWLGGAERLANSWKSGFLFRPGMTARELKLWGVIILVAVILSVLL